MKKFLLTIFAALSATVAMTAQTTKTYTDDLVVTINEESTEPAPANVDVTFNEDNTIVFTLTNFALAAGDDLMYVGNIKIENLAVTEEDGLKTFAYDGNLLITAGDQEGVAETDWLGPLLGEIPLKLKGELTDEQLHVTIDIDMMATLGQVIYVQFGSEIETGIKSVSANAAASQAFDLQGRRVNATQKGLVIVNGKKYFNK